MGDDIPIGRIPKKIHLTNKSKVGSGFFEIMLLMQNKIKNNKQTALCCSTVAKAAGVLKLLHKNTKAKSWRCLCPSLSEPTPIK